MSIYDFLPIYLCIFHNFRESIIQSVETVSTYNGKTYWQPWYYYSQSYDVPYYFIDDVSYFTCGYAQCEYQQCEIIELRTNKYKNATTVLKINFTDNYTIAGLYDIMDINNNSNGANNCYSITDITNENNHEQNERFFKFELPTYWGSNSLGNSKITDFPYSVYNTYTKKEYIAYKEVTKKTIFGCYADKCESE
jgi:hypothetical protein